MIAVKAGEDVQAADQVVRVKLCILKFFRSSCKKTSRRLCHFDRRNLIVLKTEVSWGQYDILYINNLSYNSALCFPGSQFYYYTVGQIIRSESTCPWLRVFQGRFSNPVSDLNMS